MIWEAKQMRLQCKRRGCGGSKKWCIRLKLNASRKCELRWSCCCKRGSDLMNCNDARDLNMCEQLKTQFKPLYHTKNASECRNTCWLKKKCRPERDSKNMSLRLACRKRWLPTWSWKQTKSCLSRSKSKKKKKSCGRQGKSSKNFRKKLIIKKEKWEKSGICKPSNKNKKSKMSASKSNPKLRNLK